MWFTDWLIFLWRLLLKGSVASYMRHKSWIALQCNSTVPRYSYIINIRCVNVVTIMLTGLLWKNYSDQFWMVCDYDVYRSVNLLVNWPGSVVTRLTKFAWSNFVQNKRRASWCKSLNEAKHPWWQKPQRTGVF